MALANQNNEQLGLRGEEYVQALIAKNRAPRRSCRPSASSPPSPSSERHRQRLAPAPARAARGIGRTTAGSRASIVELRRRRLLATAASIAAPLRSARRRQHQPLPRRVGDVANLQSAEAQIAQRRELLLDLQATVLLNVAQVYYQVLRSERSADVLQNTLAVQEARLEDVQQQFKNGLAIRLSVAQTQAQVDATRVGLIAGRSDVAQRPALLALLIGVPVGGREADRKTSPPPASHDPLAEFEQRAVASRQDLLRAPRRRSRRRGTRWTRRSRSITRRSRSTSAASSIASSSATRASGTRSSPPTSRSSRPG